MTTRNLAAWNVLASSGKLDSTAGADGLPKPITFRFDVADTMALVKNGFGWESVGSETIDTAAGETEKGVRYTYAAQPNPTNDSTAEKRFYFDEMNELCFKMRFHVPANYFHRACLNVSVAGDISAWAIGDSILGGDGTSTAAIYWITGANVYLLFAQNDLVAAPIWTANITNVTRSQVRTATRVGNEPSNNKILAFWGMATLMQEHHLALDGSYTQTNKAVVRFIITLVLIIRLSERCQTRPALMQHLSEIQI